jgi:hypothetical protein
VKELEVLEMIPLPLRPLAELAHRCFYLLEELAELVLLQQPLVLEELE